MLPIGSSKKGRIKDSTMKIITLQKIAESLIPGTRSMLKAIQNFLDFVELVKIRKIEKTRRLLEIYFTMEFTIEEGTFDIHLVNFKVLVRYICKKYLDGFKMSNRFSCLVVIYTFNLNESFATNLTFFRIMTTASSSLF